MAPPSPRTLLLEAYARALAAVEPRAAVREVLRAAPPRAPWVLFAAGKAAAGMAQGALDTASAPPFAGLVVVPDSMPPFDPAGLRVIRAGHPLPDAQSLAAGEAVEALLAQAPVEAELVVLLSGGASALVERPAPGVTLDDLRALNRWLLGGGLAIDALNRVRAACSTLKGGRLAARWGRRPARVLAISDVPGDRVADIGSGPFALPNPAPLPELPPGFARLATASPRDVPTIPHRVIAANAQARAAALAYAAAQGVPAHDHGATLAGDAAACGASLAALLFDASPGLHVWGGETTVRLPASPGRGGRCQHLALAAARALAGREDIVLLAAGTDGRDGPGRAAGALVGGGTVARAALEGFDADDAIARADAGSLLEAAGDLVDTGPTGTNVADIVIALKR